MGETCTYGIDEKFIYSLARRCVRKRLLGRPVHRWEINVLNLEEIQCIGMDFIGLAHDRD
jgi:hypothetical protein